MTHSSMRYLRELCIVSFGFASIISAIPTSARNISTSLLNVIKPQDIGIVRDFRGRALPEKATVWFLYRAQLYLYQHTVQLHGDAFLPSWDVGPTDEYRLVLKVRGFDATQNSMTTGSSFYAIFYILLTELIQLQPEDGFWELEWIIINKAMPPGSPMGRVSLKIADAQTLQ